MEQGADTGSTGPGGASRGHGRRHGTSAYGRTRPAGSDGVDSADTTESAAEFVGVLKALAHPMRLQILQWLRDPATQFPLQDGPGRSGANDAGEGGQVEDPYAYGVCLKQITDRTGLAQSTVSSFMQCLERQNLVISTRVGKWTHYRRNEDYIAELRNLFADII